MQEFTDDRAELFTLRVQRWRGDLVQGLRIAYGEEVAAALSGRLIEHAAAANRDRPHDLHLLDLQRSLQPDWLQLPEMVGYAAYADRFAGDLAGVGEHIDYLRELGVRYLHLMPLSTPRPGDNDGGYAVADYRGVRPDLGTVSDLRGLATTLRRNGISLVLDLVLNHVAREHAWAQAARAGDEHYRGYFLTFPDRTEPDRYEATLPEVFPDFAPGNFTWDEDLSRWAWTTFNSWQWDLNWANPEVFVEFTEIVFYLANLGVEVLRLDAIAFIWKRMGTDCQNQPEVHALTQALRALVRIACPAVSFKAEAIVSPSQLVHYLGMGRYDGKVSDLAYHNTLMVQTWSMLATGDTRLAAHTLARLPDTPSTATWLTYVRCHDDIGWAIDDADAADVGLSGFEHRRFLSDYYSGAFPGSPARGLVFQENPATADRRISGTTASLTGIESGEMDSALGRIFLAYAIAYGWGGIPVVWSGDELGLTDDPDWADEPSHSGDNRWAHRPALDWAVAAQRHDSSTVAGRVFSGLAHLARVRASLPQLHARIPSRVLAVSDRVLATARNAPIGAMVCLYNVTDAWQPFPAGVIQDVGVHEPWDVISDRPVHPDGDGNYWLTPYAAWWLVTRDD